MKLINVTKDNWEQVILLTTSHDGKHTLGEEFVASNAYSILQSQFESGWTVKAIQNQDELIGFTMYGWNAEARFYELCRFMIDNRYKAKVMDRKR